MELEVDGRSVFAGTGGRAFDAALPVLVFIHGAGMDHTVWALQSRYFAHRGRSVLALDLPGHGKSQGPAPTDIAAMAEWVVRFLDAAAVEQAVLVGHSMGALVALEVAARHQGRVAGLALCGAALKMPVHPDLLAAAEDNDPSAAALIVSWAHGQTGHLGGARLPGAWLMGGGDALLRKAAPGVLHNDLAACDGYQEAAAACARITCPTEVVIGTEDRMTPAKAGRALADAIPNGNAAVLAGAGHMMMLEAPDDTLAALKTFLQERT